VCLQQFCLSRCPDMRSSCDRRSRVTKHDLTRLLEDVQGSDNMRWHISPQGMAIQDYAAQTAAANVARVSQVFVHDDGAQRGALAAAMTAAGSGDLNSRLPPGASFFCPDAAVAAA
jgi:hypothetical protein